MSESHDLLYVHLNFMIHCSERERKTHVCLLWIKITTRDQQEIVTEKCCLIYEKPRRKWNDEIYQLHHFWLCLMITKRGLESAWSLSLSTNLFMERERECVCVLCAWERNIFYVSTNNESYNLHDFYLQQRDRILWPTYIY